MSADALAACPFCGNVSPALFRAGEVHFVKCWGCGASVPGETAAAAAGTWNRRSAPREVGNPAGRPTERPTPAALADCEWCSGTGRFSDHACRFCYGKGRGPLAPPFASLEDDPR